MVGGSHSAFCDSGYNQSHYKECMQGAIFMKQNMKFGLILGRLAILKKKLGELWATFEASFFMFSWAKKNKDKIENIFSSQNFFQKSNHRICLSILISSQDRKTNSLVSFLEEILAGTFAFEIYWPLASPLKSCIIFFSAKKHFQLCLAPFTSPRDLSIMTLPDTYGVINHK